MLSRTSEYALQAVVALAERQGTPVKSQELAAVTGAPAPYLMTILKTLARTDMVASFAGRNGGYTLAMPAHEISLLDVVDAVDPPRLTSCCPLAKPEHEEDLCPLHSTIKAAEKCVERVFSERTIADIATQHGTSSIGGPDVSNE